MKLSQKNKKLLSAISYAAAMFSLLIALTMLFSFLQLKYVKPLENPVLIELKKSFDANPSSADLKEQIRALDLMSRKAYFSSRWQIETGSYLLLLGAFVFILTQRILTDNEKQYPEQSISESVLAKKLKLRRSLLGASLFIFATAIIISFSMRKILPQPKVVQEELISEGINKTATSINPIEPEAKLEEPNETIAENISVDSVSIEGEVPIKKEIATSKEIEKKEEKPIIVARKEESNYPFFRGNSQGKVGSGNYPTEWNAKEDKNIRWKTKIPLQGNNSPIIWGDKLLLTGAENNQAKVFCLDKRSGEILWEVDASHIPGEPTNAPATSDDTGLAAPTAATNGSDVVAIFGTGNIICISLEGKTRWAKNIGIPDNHYGHSSSLVIYKNKVLVQYDHHQSKSLIALDLKNGNKLWETKRAVALSWASPVLADFDGITQVILSSDPDVISYDAETGKELWKVNCMSAEVGPSVGINSKYVYAANEFAKLVAIKPGKNAEIVWSDNEYLPEVSSPLATDNYLFVATSYGAIACYDAMLGDKLWEYEFDYGFYSSAILVGDLVYLIDQSGMMHIFKADNAFHLIAESPLGESVVTTPAFSEGKIYIRGEKYIYCISE
ncbi:MAG: PQQ-like beta-propeller repeat protein [Bacteroidales bacterium]|nr:PQQ-like beta-propeller repeat protein [Bacteroidales bacterium]